jgi:hypothetical protein
MLFVFDAHPPSSIIVLSAIIYVLLESSIVCYYGYQTGLSPLVCVVLIPIVAFAALAACFVHHGCCYSHWLCCAPLDCWWLLRIPLWSWRSSADALGPSFSWEHLCRCCSSWSGAKGLQLGGWSGELDVRQDHKLSCFWCIYCTPLVLLVCTSWLCFFFMQTLIALNDAIVTWLVTCC